MGRQHQVAKTSKRAYGFGKSVLTIEFGDITKSKADVIVSSDDNYISMGGGVSASILRAGGQEIIIDAAKKAPARVGDVVVTTAGRLPANYIFHAITIGDEDLAPSAILQETISRCFDLLEVLGLHSIAFPAIGAGVAGFAYEDVAVEMANIITPRLLSSTSSIEVTVFLFDRFGQMQPIDFVRFFEEFRAKMPDAAAHEILTPVISPREPAIVQKPTEQIAGRHDLLLAISRLTEERAGLEEQLARTMGGDRVNKDQAVRARLADLQEQKLELLAKLSRSTDPKVFVFISYAHEDQKPFLEELRKQLVILKRLNVVEDWYDRDITAGTEWRGEIGSQLNSAQLVLLLISPDFIASDYCYDLEMKTALERHERSEARVIPIILRPCMWSSAPFAKLQALPLDGKPISSWSERDAAFLSVAEGIRSAVESINAKTQSKWD
jgi:O-acetyl-ADP-ribose deacetylase (regulator of RNase III)